MTDGPATAPRRPAQGDAAGGTRPAGTLRPITGQESVERAAARRVGGGALKPSKTRNRTVLTWLPAGVDSVLACALVVGGALVSTGTLQRWADGPLVTACESGLKYTLAAPSTYRRTSIAAGSETIGYDQYRKGSGASPMEIKLAQEQHRPAIRFAARFAFEAPIDALMVKIDGKSFCDRLRGAMLRTAGDGLSFRLL